MFFYEKWIRIDLNNSRVERHIVYIGIYYSITKNYLWINIHYYIKCKY